MYFVSGAELWQWDGDPAGPRKVINLDGILRMADVDGTLFIAVYTATGLDLYRSDGTAQGTVRIKHTGAPVFPLRMWNVRGKLLLWASPQVWASDGTEEGTIQLLRLPFLDQCDLHDRDFALAGGVLYWFQADGSSRLWRSDGTPSGTFELVHQEPQPESRVEPCSAHSIATANGLVYFTGNDAQSGIEPWVTDGTISGTHLLYDIKPGPASSDASGFARARPDALLHRRRRISRNRAVGAATRRRHVTASRHEAVRRRIAVN